MIWPGRKRFRSDASGSLTFTISSACWNICIRDDLGAGCNVFLVGDAGASAGHGFDRDPISPGAQRLDRLWGEADTVFVGLDFLWNADEHCRLSTSVN
jgi:hypothetical protein